MLVGFKGLKNELHRLYFSREGFKKNSLNFMPVSAYEI